MEVSMRYLWVILGQWGHSAELPMKVNGALPPDIAHLSTTEGEGGGEPRISPA